MADLTNGAAALRAYSFQEEACHAVTHGVGALLSIAGSAVLLAAAAETGPAARMAVALYGGSLVLVYVASTLYHGLARPAPKRFFLLLDHCAVYLLVGGTFTPLALLLPPAAALALLGTIWALVGLGIACKVMAHRLDLFERIDSASAVLCVIVCWAAGVVIGEALLARAGMEAVAWLLAGGLAYSVGVGFYLWHRLPFNHTLWHLLVLLGSACHYYAILVHVLPRLS